MIVAAALLFAFAAMPTDACAAGRGEQPQPSLFERSPLGFSWRTIDEVRKRITHIPQFVGELPQNVSRSLHAYGVQSAALRFLLIVTIVTGLLVRRRISDWVGLELTPLTSRVPGKGARWISSAVQIFSDAAVPVAMWALYLFVAALTSYQNASFAVLGTMLLAWTEYTIALSATRELLTRPLLTVPVEYRRYLYGMGRWLLIYGILVDALLKSLRELGMPPDVIALYRWIFELSLIGLLAIAFSHRRAVILLFPDLPNRPYRAFVRGLDRIYPLVFVLTLLMALLQWAGYHRLAGLVWIRTWALAGLFVVAVMLHHALCAGLRRLILGADADSKEAKIFYASTRRLLDYIGSIIVVLIALKLTALNRPLMQLLDVQLGTLGAHPLTPLILIEAGAIVAGFVFVAQLLRDYLEYQVYPALNVDLGVAHAIDTFIIYSLAAIGSLAALEVVGLGVGTITLFAGALGIGLGFGLQSIANNFASGLMIIFGRELRRGDIVTVGDTVGVVEQVGTRATRMKTRDDVEYLVPNAEFISGKIINWTRSSPQVRLHVPVGVSYDAYPMRVREILEKVAAATPTVLKFPPPEVWFVGFGDSSLNFELLVWMNIRRYQRNKVASDLYFAIFEAFKEAGIEIPFPQRDLHIRSAEGLNMPAIRKNH
jgi:small-conductance mechanosensitive channel